MNISQTDSICSAPMEYGDCENNVLSYFYRSDISRCEAFNYSGCGGNGNRFETEEQCERQCGSYKGVRKILIENSQTLYTRK